MFYASACDAAGHLTEDEMGGSCASWELPFPKGRRMTTATPLLMLLPVAGGLWWLLGFPPGWGWLVLPVFPGMPVSLGMLVVLAAVVVAAYSGLAWLRNNI